MTTLIPTPTFSSNLVVKNQSPTHPIWDNSSGANILSTLGTYSQWWNDTTPSPNNPDAFYSNDQQDNIIRSYTQYGQNNNKVWASAKFIKVIYTLANEVINADNSITVDISISVYGASKIVQNPGTGFSVVNTIKLGSTTVLSHTGKTTDSYSFDPNGGNAYTFTGVTLPPRSTFDSSKLVYTSHFPNGEAPDANINIGSTLFNPLYETYIPLKVKSGGVWNIVNSSPTGNIKIKVNGVWTTVSPNNIGTQNQANTGHTQYKSEGSWLQSPLPK